MVSSGVWKDFFILNPVRSDTKENIKALFSDPLSEDGNLIDERENILFIYEFTGREMPSFLKNILFST